MKPREKPIDPDPNILPRKYPDENKWMWDMYVNLEEKLKLAVKPLEDYLESFNEFLPILMQNADEMTR